MTTEREYQELYDRLLDEVRTLHKNNRRRIRNGMRMLLVVTVGLMLLMFLAQGNKVFTLMLWIFSMFAVAAYLIAVEYADYELQKKLEQITQMELESMGALLELPELPRMPRLPDRRYHGRREETTANIVIESEPVSAEDAQEPMARRATLWRIFCRRYTGGHRRNRSRRHRRSGRRRRKRRTCRKCRRAALPAAHSCWRGCCVTRRSWRAIWSC